ncbi:hypothetical protein L1049_003618 [Liquidambar formosana]|uniref:PHD-type domain-containing protein n=1 Tax=Liquidambar formosana TaxID=63359 RepID=A0AAP0RR79_LIQFO
MKDCLRSGNLSAMPEKDKVYLSPEKNVDGVIDDGDCDLGNQEKGFELNSEERLVLISSDLELVEKSLGSSPKRSTEIERKTDELENAACSEDGDKGRRGRKRSRGDGNGCDEGDGVEVKKVKEEPLDGKVEIVGRVLRSRIAAIREGEKEKSGSGMEVALGQSGGIVVGKRNRGSGRVDKERIEMEKDESKGIIGEVRNKLKRKRGRPVKIKGENGSSKVVLGKEGKVAGFNKSRSHKFADNVKHEPNSNLSSERRLFGKELNSKRFSSAGKNKSGDLETEDNETSYGLRPKRVNAFNVEKKKRSKEGKINGKKEKVGPRRATEKQMLREQIMAMLLSSGWTIEYRPRISKEYNDAVYVSPEGRGYWSVTLAYRMLKQQFENGDGDGKYGKTSSSFTPIPEEVLNKLTRVTKKKKEREMKLKLKAEGGSNSDDGVIKKKSAKKKHGAENTSSVRHREKRNSCIRMGAKSLKGRMKEKSLLDEEDNSTGTSQKRVPKSVRSRKSQETQNRKRCALLVRSSKEGVGLDTDGYIPYYGKRTVLTWMIDLGTVPLNGKVRYMNRRKTRAMLEGRITRDGIHCDCCSEILPISKFETHAGSNRLCQPFENIILETGASLLQCQLDSWYKQEDSERKGFHLIDVGGEDPNDDTCGICGDGGDLICCDSCPSTFHQSCLDIQKFPSGDWHCVYCSCKFCGMVEGNNGQRVDNHDRAVPALLKCCLCEEKYHHLCIQDKDAINDASSRASFCGKKCQELFERLQKLLGVKHELEEGFSWTLLQRCDVGPDLSLSGMPQKVACNSKLAVALSVMDECFLPIVDHRSRINLIHNILYNCGSNFNRLNYSGFYTAILERSDEIISAASIRIHGNQLAEMPFIGTRHTYRRQGMCSRLLSAIESAFCSLNVEKLVIPAISELMQTWTSVFGFKPLEASKKQEMRNMNMLVFPGTDMLQKPLLKHHDSDENNAAAADLKSTELGKVCQTLHAEANKSDVSFSARPDVNISGEDSAPHTHHINDEAVAGESGSQLPDGSLNDTSDITSETVNFPEYAIDTKCNATHDNLEGANRTVINSQVSAYDAHEQNAQYTTEEINEYQNASGSIVPATHEKTGEWDSKLSQQSKCEVESKSFVVPCIVSEATDCEGRILHASMEGTETVASEEKREVDIVNNGLISHDEGSEHSADVNWPQDVAHVHGLQVSGENIDCHDSEAIIHMSHDAKNNKHHDSEHLQVTGCTLDADDDEVLGTHEVKNEVAVVAHMSGSLGEEIEVHSASVDANCHLLCGASVAATEPNFQSSCTSNGFCKSMKLTPVFDKSDLPGVESCVLSCPAGVSQNAASKVTVDDFHYLKEASTTQQTDFLFLDEDPDRSQVVTESSNELESDSQVDHTDVIQCNSESLCNSSSGSGVTLLCAPGGCNAGGTPEVIVLSNQAS